MNNISLTIMMTDSGGNGWSSNIMAIKQNGVVVGTFGSGFTRGFVSGPIYISVQGDVEVQVGVSTLGTKTEEVGFAIWAFNGSKIF